VITRYEIEPATGVKGAQIVNLAKDLARSLSLVSHPRGRDHPGQELHGAGAAQRASARRSAWPRSWARRSTTSAASLLTMGLGKDIVGNPVVADLGEDAALPGGRHHRLGQVGGHQRHDPEPARTRPRRATCGCILIDPKMLEMSGLRGHPAPAGARWSPT
jgi:S-DNA-T family DNA segregation ATPase FtsK/SpoIIIE